MTQNPTLRECAEELLAWMKEGPSDRAKKRLLARKTRAERLLRGQGEEG